MTIDPSALQIKMAGPKDLEHLLALYRTLIPNDLEASAEVQVETFRQILDQPRLCILLGFLDGTAVSTCAVSVVPNLTRGCSPYALIENVVTHSDWRGHGIGRAVVEAACQHAWDQGCFKVMLMSGSTNSKAHAFYERVGFTRTKVAFEKRQPGIPSRRTAD